VPRLSPSPAKLPCYQRLIIYFAIVPEGSRCLLQIPFLLVVHAFVFGTRSNLSEKEINV
jgi:hypothetical protein